MVKGFKPNLIPNNPKDGSFGIEQRNAVMIKNGGHSKYYGIFKKDGCRLHLGLTDEIKTRALKAPKSILVQERFKTLNDLCLELKIALDGEFYMHGLKFNEIMRYFSKSDVTTEEYKQELEKAFKKDPKKFMKKYEGRTIPFLTKFHEGLKFWLFDGIILDRPDLVGFDERMKEIYLRLSNHTIHWEEEDVQKLFEYIEFPELEEFENIEAVQGLYEEALECGFEGLVVVHKDHEYKYGRNSIKQGTLLKLKNDECEFDAVIIDVVEGTKVKEGIEKTTNELGRSETSRKKGDRNPSGKAKGFLVEFEDKGQFVVGLKGFDDEAKVELLNNKENYIGKHFQYKAMEPVKDYPRHAYFDCWRDEK